MQKVSAKKMRDLLLRELHQAQARNPSFSLRSFAKALDLNHSVLSRILNGKRKPTLAIAKKFVSKRGIPLEHVLYAPVKTAGKLTSNSIRTSMKNEDFSVVATWMHFAMQSLLEQQENGVGIEILADRVGVRKDTAERLLGDLCQIGVAARKNDETFICVKRDLSVGNQLTFGCAREFNRGLLQKAEKAMDEVAFELRNLTSIVFNMQPTELPEAFKTIADFRRGFCAKYERNETQSNVYSLQVQLIPFTTSSQ